MPSAIARSHLLDAAEKLLSVLYTLNRWGDEVAPGLALQHDGYAYGDVHKGLTELLCCLYPGLAEQVLDIAVRSDISLREAHAHVVQTAAEG